MKTFHQYINEMPVVSEEIHQNITAVLNAEHVPASHKLNRITAEIRGAIKRGETTGLEDAKPKKGSSRAVFFPKEPTKVHLDGKEAHIHTALKVAFPGQLDKYNKSGRLLGEHQNMVEGEHFTNHHYGILTKTGEHDGVSHFKTNHDSGVLAPMIHAHEEGHHIMFGKIDPIKSGDFRNLTKTKEFPKGVSHQEFYDAVNHHFALSHGGRHHTTMSDERMEKVQEHPFVEKVQNYTADTGAHPADLHKGNMGVWTHPHTGEKHLVISDYGYSTEVAKHYNDARRSQYQSRGWQINN